MSRSDSELIVCALVNEDRDAFGELVQRHQSAVRHFLRHLSHGDRALADDLAQETFLHAFRRLDQFRGDSSFTTWLLGIAHNHSRNARRRLKNQVALDENIPADGGERSAVDASDLRHDLAHALQKLTVEEQLAVHLGYQQGLSHSEIASVADWPLGTVKTHLARGKEKLRHLLVAWNSPP